MNKWKQFAEMFGLELEEEFNIKNVEDNEIYDDVYKISEDGLLFNNNGKWWRLTEDRELPYDLLRGYYEVVKKPWKPKEGERYWYYWLGIEKALTTTWSDYPDDYVIWKLGDCFKTKEEAEAKGKEIMKQIKKEYDNA